MPEADSDITTLLQSWLAGDGDALEALAPRVLSELRRIAASHLAREGAELTLDPTALVNEAFVRLVECRRLVLTDRANFYGFVAHLMRRVLVDRARRRDTGKRRGERVSLEDPLLRAGAWRVPEDADLVALDDALRELGELDPVAHRVVELRFFGGLSYGDVAALLGRSPRTVRRKWETARLLLYDRVANG